MLKVSLLLIFFALDIRRFPCRSRYFRGGFIFAKVAFYEFRNSTEATLRAQPYAHTHTLAYTRAHTQSWAVKQAHTRSYSNRNIHGWTQTFRKI